MGVPLLARLPRTGFSALPADLCSQRRPDRPWRGASACPLSDARQVAVHVSTGKASMRSTPSGLCQTNDGQVHRSALMLGGLIILANWPWTLLVIKPVNTALMETEPSAAGPETRSFMKRWNSLHAVRT